MTLLVSLYLQPRSSGPASCILSSGSRLRSRKSGLSPCQENPKPGNPVFSERKHFHGEEVGRYQCRHVSTDKVFPTRRLLPLGSRWNIMAAQNIAYRLIREPQTQVGHGAHDPVIAPPGIFFRHPHHQPLGFLVRSEEHTSELQSLRHLVCRLLLEKKKNSRHLG